MMFGWMATPLSAGELWRRLPVVDRDTGNLSLMRCGSLVMLACWCHVAENSHDFSWASVAILGIIVVAMLAKSMGDLKTGFTAIGGIFRNRRSTDRYQSVSGFEPTAREGE